MSYGCFNHEPYGKLIPLPAVYNIEYEGHAVVCDAHQLVANVFKKDCQYTLSKLGQVDPGCTGCKNKVELKQGETVG